MTDTTLWINRIVCGAVTVIMILICEKFNIRPAWCFILAFITLIGITFLFEIIKYIMND